METEKLIQALEETILLLQTSESSGWSDMSVEEITGTLEAELARARSAKPVDVKILDLLFAPTGAMQETSMDNGWGTTFLRMADVIDQFTAEGS